MAGESARFRDAGFEQPKHELLAHGAPLFDHAVGSFAAYFESDDFLFVVRGADAEAFVRKRCEVLAIKSTKIVVLEDTTRGQAETVFFGSDEAGVADLEDIAVFNIDTFRPGYRKPSLLRDERVDGYLEVFRGSGANWSFVAPDPARPLRVAETAEKRPISDLCCTGLYYFRRAGDFRWAYRNPCPPRGEAESRERYVAPLYNALIAAGRLIGFEIVDRSDAIFCGTPDEYEHVLVSEAIKRRLAR